MRQSIEISNLWAILSSLLIGTLIGTMGNSMVSIALPSFMNSFQIPLTSAVWSLTLYTLTFSVLIPVFGSLGSAIGYKRMFITGMWLTAGCSIFCIYAPNYTFFLLARIGIGVGVATILPTIMGVIGNFFPLEMQGRATGMWALVNSLGHAIGPSLGGFLLGFFNWQSIFWINIPLSILSIAMAYRVFPKDQPIGSVHSFDWWGASAMTVFVFSAMIGLSQSAKYGFQTAQSLALWGVALAALVFIFVHERNQASPFINFKLFSKKDYIAAIAPISLQAFTQFGLLVSLPIFLIDIHGVGKGLAGVIIMSMTMMMAISSPIAGRWVDQWASKGICLIGTLLIGVGAALMYFMKAVALTTLGWTLFLLILVIFGVGFGMIQSSSTVAVIQAAPKDISGAATGFFHMIRFICASLGSTVIGILLESGAQVNGSAFYQSFLLIIILAALTAPVTRWIGPAVKSQAPANQFE